jgi:hypothetical protein
MFFFVYLICILDKKTFTFSGILELDISKARGELGILN